VLDMEHRGLVERCDRGAFQLGWHGSQTAMHNGSGLDSPSSRAGDVEPDQSAASEFGFAGSGLPKSAQNAWLPEPVCYDYTGRPRAQRKEQR
jgi:hypothetical protein